MSDTIAAIDKGRIVECYVLTSGTVTPKEIIGAYKNMESQCVEHFLTRDRMDKKQ